MPRACIQGIHFRCVDKWRDDLGHFLVERVDLVRYDIHSRGR